MKIIIGILLGCFLLGCGFEKTKEQIVISGKAPAMKKIVLTYNTGLFKSVAETVADSTGNFSLSCKLIRPGMYVLSCHETKQSIPVFAKPGWEIQAGIGENGIFVGGDGQEQNQFMKLLREKKADLLQQYPLDVMDVNSYKTNVFTRYGEIKAFIRSAKLKDPDFEGIINANELVDAYNSVLNYSFLSQLVSGIPAVLPEDYYDFLPEMDFSSGYLLYLGNINPFLQSAFTAMENEGVLQTGLTDYLLKRAEYISDAQVRENYLLYALDLELFGYNQYLKESIAGVEPFILTATGKESLKELKERYDRQSRQNAGLNAGQFAPDFSGIDVQGKRHTLSDFAGKVVVLDVWNTGCKPCIAEIPYLKKLEARFAGDEVVFISFSLEAEQEKWRDFVVEHGMDGHQWIETEAFKSAFARYYQVWSIPRFMVFDRAGKIVEVYAPRPSSPRLAALIENELKK